MPTLKRVIVRVLACFVLLFLLPLATHALWWWGRGWPDSWAGADWSSAGLLPQAEAEPDAVVHLMAARVGRWRGIFAHHTWLVLKEAGAKRYSRYDVVGWGTPVRVDQRAPDARWYGNEPVVLVSLRGAEAAAAIPRLKAAISGYQYAGVGSYNAWPGPNSNTFISTLAAAVPALAPGLLPTAIGKDYRAPGLYAGWAPSRTGVQVSLKGLLGLTLAGVEGVELDVLGTVAGVDFRRPALKLPGWGRIGMAPA